MAASFGYRHVVTPTRLIVSMVFVWLGARSLIGTLPFLLVLDLSFEKALFESVSGLTTTGATTFVDARGAAAVDPVLASATGMDRRLPDTRLAVPGPVAARDRRLAAPRDGVGMVAWIKNAARDAGFEHLKRYMPMLGYLSRRFGDRVLPVCRQRDGQPRRGASDDDKHRDRRLQSL
jgi:hypothetical protein